MISRKELKAFQGNLKKDNPNEIAALSRRMIKHGFSAPIFVWENEKYILDGHQRLKALNVLATEEEILDKDMVPVVMIKAETKAEARMRVAEYNSSYSVIDQEFADEYFA